MIAHSPLLTFLFFFLFLFLFLHLPSVSSQTRSDIGLPGCYRLSANRNDKNRALRCNSGDVFITGGFNNDLGFSGVSFAAFYPDKQSYLTEEGFYVSSSIVCCRVPNDTCRTQKYESNFQVPSDFVVTNIGFDCKDDRLNGARIQWDGSRFSGRCNNYDWHGFNGIFFFSREPDGYITTCRRSVFRYRQPNEVTTLKLAITTRIECSFGFRGFIRRIGVGPDANSFCAWSDRNEATIQDLVYICPTIPTSEWQRLGIQSMTSDVISGQTIRITCRPGWQSSNTTFTCSPALGTNFFPGCVPQTCGSSLPALGNGTWVYSHPSNQLRVEFPAFLSCPVGQAPSPTSAVNCLVDSAGRLSRSPLPVCSGLSVSDISFNSSTFGNYAFDLTWRAPTNPGVEVLHYQVVINVTYPSLSPLEVQANPSFLSGIKLSNSFQVRHFNNQSLYRLAVQMDELELIAGLATIVSITPVAAASRGSDSTNIIRLPCGCDKIAATGGSFDGLPQRFQIFHDVESNQLFARFTPNSLCASIYRISIYSSRQPFAVVNSTVETIPIANFASCPYRSEVTQPITQVDGAVIVPGISYRYEISPLPQRVCFSCTSLFTADVGLVREDFTGFFTFLVTGLVTTPISTASPTAVGLEGVTVTVTLYSIADVLMRQPLHSQVFTTNINGAYRGRVMTKALSNPPYAVKVQPSQIDLLSDGSSFEHVFISSFNQSQNYFYSRVNIADELSEVTFRDTSTVEISGRVVLDWFARDELGNRYETFVNPILRAKASASTGSFSGSGNCGVPGVVIEVYAADDLTRLLSRSEPSAKDGSFSVSAVVYSNVILVPKYSPESTSSTSASNDVDSVSAELPVHTFSPSSIPLRIGTKPVVLDPIADTTMNNITIGFYGGARSNHIGAIRPILRLPTCTGLNSIPLPLFGDPSRWDKNTRMMTVTVPAQKFQLLWRGEVPNLPAGVSIGFQPSRGSTNPFKFKTTATGPDRLVDALDPYWSLSDAARWLSTVPSTAVDLTNSTNPAMIELRYIAPPIATLKRVMPASVCNQGASNQFYTLASRMPYKLRFELTEVYGPASSIANPNLIYSGFTTERNVTASVVFNDGFSSVSEPLTVPDGQCENTVCNINAVYNETNDVTVVEYLFVAGEVEISPFTQVVPYSRYSWFYANSSQASTGILNQQERQNLYAVIAGIKTYEGALTLQYPPQAALYILRDPPGSQSTASFTAGSTVHTGITAHGARSGHVGATLELAVVLNPGADMCAGIGISACLDKSDIDFVFAGGLAAGYETSTETSKSTVFSYDFAQTVTTTNNPGVANGDGDMFLTMTGTVSVSKAIRIAVNNCTVSSTPLNTWQLDPNPTMTWLSQTDIRDVVIPDLKASSEAFAIQLGYGSLAELQAANYVVPPKSAFPPTMSQAEYNRLPGLIDNIRKNEKSISDWQGLLGYNEYLKGAASKFVDFYQHIGPNSNAFKNTIAGGNPYADPNFVESAINSAPKTPSRFVNPSLSDIKDASSSSLSSEEQKMVTASDAGEGISYIKSNDESLSRWSPFDQKQPKSPYEFGPNLQADFDAESLSFFGGSSAIDMVLTTTLERTSDEVSQKVVNFDAHLGLQFEFSIFGAGAGGTFDVNGGFSFSSAIAREVGQAFQNSIAVHLEDADQGDNFKIAILKDPVYNSPVYKVLSGKSRCMNEKGTMNRDEVDIQFDNSAITGAHPDLPIATTVTITNKSPTEDTFVYSLVISEATNRQGLELYMNGMVLSSHRLSMMIELPYNQPMTFLLEARRSKAAGYSFRGVVFKVLGFADEVDDTVCYEANRPLSIEYLSPCNKAVFAGKYVAGVPFLISSNSGPAISLTVFNPESNIPARKWRVNAAKGQLLDMFIEFRSAESTERDWTPCINYETGQPVQVVLPKSETDLYQDVFSFKWDVSSLSEGNYYVRVRTQCALVSDIDESLNAFIAPQLEGYIDQRRPRVFGSPVPSPIERWIPGTEISLTFTEPIFCRLARAQYWVVPNEFDANSFGFNLAAANSLVRPALTLCDAQKSKLYIAFEAPNYAEMEDHYVNVYVTSIFDQAYNPLLYMGNNFVMFNFPVANFSSMSPFLPGAGGGSGFNTAELLNGLLGGGSGSGENATVPSSMNTAITLALAQDINQLLSVSRGQGAILNSLRQELADLITLALAANQTQTAIQQQQNRIEATEQIQSARLLSIESVQEKLLNQSTTQYQVILDNQFAISSSLNLIRTFQSSVLSQSLENIYSTVASINSTLLPTVRNDLSFIQSALGDIRNATGTYQSTLDRLSFSVSQLTDSTQGISVAQQSVLSVIQSNQLEIQATLQSIVKQIQSLSFNVTGTGGGGGSVSGSPIINVNVTVNPIITVNPTPVTVIVNQTGSSPVVVNVPSNTTVNGDLSAIMQALQQLKSLITDSRDKLSHLVAESALHSTKLNSLSAAWDRVNPGYLDEVNNYNFVSFSSAFDYTGIYSLNNVNQVLFASGSTASSLFANVSRFDVNTTALFSLNRGFGPFTPTITAGAIQLTSNTMENANSMFLRTPINVLRNFEINLRFYVNPTSGMIADGMCVVVHNDTRGTAATGSPGCGLGYFLCSPGTAVITRSAAVCFDFFNNRLLYGTDGSTATQVFSSLFSTATPIQSTANTFGANILYDSRLTQWNVTIRTFNAAGAQLGSTFWTYRLPRALSSYTTVGTGFVGVTAGTGGQFGSFFVSSFSVLAQDTQIRSFPAPDLASPVAIRNAVSSGNSYGGRVSAATAVVDHFVYLVGGFRRSSMVLASTCRALADVQIYDGNRQNIFYTLSNSSFPQGRGLHGLAFAGGSLWVIGGETCSGTQLSDVWRSGSGSRLGLDWVQVNSADLVRAGIGPISSFPIAADEDGSQIYIVSKSLQVWRLSMATQNWTRVGSASADFPYEPYGSSLVFVPGQATLLLLMGSYRECDYCVTNRQFLFSLSSQSWTELESPRYPRTYSPRAEFSVAYVPLTQISVGSATPTPSTGILYLSGGHNYEDLWYAELNTTAIRTARGLIWRRSSVGFPSSQQYHGSGNLVYLPRTSSLYYLAYSPLAADTSIFSACLLRSNNCSSPTPSMIPTYASLITGVSLSSGSLQAKFHLRAPAKRSAADSSDSMSSQQLAQVIVDAFRRGLHLDADRFPLLSTLMCDPSSLSDGSDEQGCANPGVRVEDHPALPHYAHDAARESDYLHTGQFESLDGQSALALSVSDPALQLVDAGSLQFFSFFDAPANSLSSRLGISHERSPSQSSGEHVLTSSLEIHWRARGHSVIKSNMLSLSLYRVFNTSLHDPDQIHHHLAQRSASSERDRSLSIIDIPGYDSKRVSFTSRYDESMDSTAFSMVFHGIPTDLGGAEYRAVLSIRSRQGSASRPLIAPWIAFLVGPPSSPTPVRLHQSAKNELEFDFIPAFQSGLTRDYHLENSFSIQYIYYVSLESARGNRSVTLPHTRIPLSLIANVSSVMQEPTMDQPVPSPLMRMTLPLESFFAHYSLADDSDSLSDATIRIGVQAQTMLASSPTHYLSMNPQPQPRPLILQSISQDELNTFSIRFSVPRLRLVQDSENLQFVKEHVKALLRLPGASDLAELELDSLAATNSSELSVIVSASISLPSSFKSAAFQLGVTQRNKAGMWSEPLWRSIERVSIGDFKFDLGSSLCQSLAASGTAKLQDAEIMLERPQLVLPSSDHFYGWEVSAPSLSSASVVVQSVNTAAVAVRRSLAQLFSSANASAAQADLTVRVRPLVWNSLNLALRRTRSSAVKLLKGEWIEQSAQQRCRDSS